MPTTTTKTTKTTKKGKGLTKKVGPFPFYVYLIGVGIVVLYLYYRHRASSSGQTSSSAGGYSQPTTGGGVDVVPSGNANTTTGDTGSSPSQPVDFPSDYVSQTDLASAIDSIDNSTAAAIAGITFPAPNINITIPSGPNSTVSKTTAKSKTAARKTPPHPQVPSRHQVVKKQPKPAPRKTVQRRGK